MRRSFGPSVYFDEKTGEPVAQCVSTGIYCFLMHGKYCSAIKPPRELPSGNITPEWCEYREGMLEDARAMRDFERMGLSDMKRRELLEMMKSLPEEYHPKPLNKADAWDLRKAIRKATLAAEPPEAA